MSRYDAVLSYHLNPLTCGTAKFNQQLAKRLGVPCLRLGSECRAPLVSVRVDEMTEGDRSAFRQWQANKPFDLLLHNRPADEPFVLCAERLFYADELGIPPTVTGNPTRGAYKVLTYGMAHKRVIHHFEKLKAQLETEHPDYTISLSTAVHEGNPWEQSVEQSESSLRELFGDKFRFLGFLADDALAKELQECDAVAAYFTPALRANNTSAWAAVQAGKTLYTNRDDLSPPLDSVPTWDKLLDALNG